MGSRKNPKEIMNDLAKQIDDDLNRLYAQIQRDLSQATPKDTGRAARGWRIEESSTIEDGRSEIPVINDVEYVEYLNKGHSRQAPAGYIEDTIQRAIDKHDRRKG